MARRNVNGRVRERDTEPDSPLPGVLREPLGLAGTKYGCGVAQCGCCQSGMLMAGATRLRDKPRPTDAGIDAAITHICRGGTCNRMYAAIEQASGQRVALQRFLAQRAAGRAVESPGVRP